MDNVLEIWNEVYNKLKKHYENTKSFDIELKEINKNGNILHGIAFKITTKDDENNYFDDIGPIFYIEDMPEESCVKDYVNYIVDYIEKEFKPCVKYINRLINDFKDIDKFKQNIYLRIYNRERVLNDTRDLSYIDVSDTESLVYTIFYEDKNFSIPVSDFIIESFNITKEEAFKNAYDNTSKLDLLFEDCFDFVCKLKGIEPIDDLSKNYLYVVAYNSPIVKIGGSASFVNVEKIYNKLNNNQFYILPSSIYETLVLVKQDTRDETDYLIDTVKYVNRDCLKTSDFLSDNIYFYDGQKLSEISL